MADGGGGDIIIKGGSVDLQFDDDVYKKNSGGDPKKHENPNGKITRIVVADENDVEKYNSGNENVMKWKVTVFAKK